MSEDHQLRPIPRPDLDHGAVDVRLMSHDLLPRWGGGTVLAVYTVLFAVLAVTTSVRRDVA